MGVLFCTKKLWRLCALFETHLFSCFSKVEAPSTVSGTNTWPNIQMNRLQTNFPIRNICSYRSASYGLQYMVIVQPEYGVKFIHTPAKPENLSGFLNDLWYMYKIM